MAQHVQHAGPVAGARVEQTLGARIPSDAEHIYSSAFATAAAAAEQLDRLRIGTHQTLANLRVALLLFFAEKQIINKRMQILKRQNNKKKDR